VTGGFGVLAGRPTVQPAGVPPSEDEQHSQNALGQPEDAPADTRPDNPPAEDHSNQSAAPQSHNIATVTDVAAVSSVVGANQPMTEDAAAQEAADVAPAEQAITSKAEPGDPVGIPGTVDAPAAEAAPVDVPTRLTDEERRLLDWHWANLEYGCSARLSQVSLAHWNQDEAWGGFGGPHCMVKGGYSGLMEPLAASLDIRQGVAISQIAYDKETVKVTSTSGAHPDHMQAANTIKLRYVYANAFVVFILSKQRGQPFSICLWCRQSEHQNLFKSCCIAVLHQLCHHCLVSTKTQFKMLKEAAAILTVAHLDREFYFANAAVP